MNELIAGRTAEEWELINSEVKNDKNYIHPREKETLQQLKDKYSDITNNKFWRGDKELYVFLFARKLDVERTAELLKNHLEFRESNNLLRRIQIEELDENIKNSGYFVPGRKGERDKLGRGITYLYMGKFLPKTYSENAQLFFAVWFFDFMVEYEYLDMFRVGMTYVESIKGAGLSNMDNSEGRKLQESMMNNFPLRIQSILVVDAGIIIRFFLAFAKLFIKKKVLQRVETVSSKDTTKYIDSNILLKDFGGEADYSIQDFWKDVQQFYDDIK